MNRSILILACALAFAGCDKKETPTPEAAAGAATTAQQAEPAEQPESQAANDKPENAMPEEKRAAMPDDLKPGEQGFYGAKFTVIEEPITLAAALEKAVKHEGDPETVKVQATVNKVCKKKGCWFTMTQDGVEADVRVRMKDYGFFVPKNAEKATVVAEGTLIEREVPQEEAQHYADDAAEQGEPAKKVEGPQKTWEFTATAVELQAVES